MDLFNIEHRIKTLFFVGNSKKIIEQFPQTVQEKALAELDQLRLGRQPLNFKYMAAVGLGAYEIRLRGKQEYRIIYVAKFREAIYVLHAFPKNSQQTKQHDIEVAKNNYVQVIKIRAANKNCP